MAKSPFSQRYPKDFSSGRLKRVSNFSQINLKNKHFQLPVSSSGSSFHMPRNRGHNLLLKEKHFLNNVKSHAKEVSLKKMKLVKKYFNHHSKSEILKSFQNKHLSMNILKNQAKLDNKNKLKKQKIGIFEREIKKHPQNINIKINKNKIKNNNEYILQENSPKARNEGIIINKIKNKNKMDNNDEEKQIKNNSNEVNFLDNKMCRTLFNQKIKSKKLPKLKIKSLIKPETPKNLISSDPLGNSILIPKPNFKKDTDTMTVTTCNTQNDVVSYCKIIEELPNRKFREVKLSDLHKHLITYSGTFYKNNF